MGKPLRSTRGLVPTVVVLGIIGAIVAACGSSGASPSTSPSGVASASATETPAATVPASPSSAVATASPTPAPTGPATFTLAVKGDANVTGTWGTSFGIDCNNPAFGGPDILFFAESPDGKAVVLVTLQSGSVGVSERAGAGATFTDREFQGTGVTVFDPARGATFDSDVAIAPNPGSKPGTLGTITHVTGSVDCGGQTPGTSTVVASGSSPEGAISGPFSISRVTCNSSAQNGQSVGVSAIIDTATPPVYLIINLPANRNATIFSVSQNPSKQHTYAMDKAGTLTITATGAHLDADFVEVLAAGVAGPAHTIHLVGDVTCGAAATS